MPNEHQHSEPDGRPTIVSVAARAGVSIASVSRYLNGIAVSADTASRVQQAADELHYVPDSTARSLKVGRTEQINFAVADLGNPVYVTMMHSLASQVTARGYRLVVSEIGDNPDDHVEFIREFDRGFADGLVLVPIRVTAGLLRALDGMRTPVTVIGSVPHDCGHDSVRANSTLGVELAVDHLVNLGMRRIAFVNGPSDTVPGTARRTGYVAALERHKIPVLAELSVVGDGFSFESGLECAHRLLDQASPDAIVCANDLLALGVMRALAVRGIRVPDEMVIVGMDNTDVGRFVNPSLTSVDLGSNVRGAAAGQLLLDRLAEPGAEPRHLDVPPRLITRESTSPRPR